MKLFSSNRSLQVKFVLALMFCCIVALLLNNVLIFSLGAQDFKKNKAIHLYLLADVLAKNSTAALRFSDTQAASETLQSANADHSIQLAILYDENCQVLAEYNQQDMSHSDDYLSKLKCIGKSKHLFSDDYLYLSTVITLNDQKIGSLLLKSSLNDWYATLFRQLKIFIILFVVTLFIAFLLTLKLQSYLLTPIKNLLSAIKHISKHQDYSTQVQSNTHDELAYLAAEFNTMIAKIKQHEDVLKNQKQVLENTVEQRTQELQVNFQQLKIAKEAAEVANKAKSDFLSHMSHDLRTPLNGLLGYVQLLQRKTDFPTQYLNEIKIIGQSGEYLLSLINDLLDLTKIESNKLELRLDTFKTTEFFTHIAKMYTHLAQNKAIEFQFLLDDHLPLALYGDNNRVRRILSNLLDNAFKFTDQGHVIFKVRYIDNQLVIQIEDSGCGIKGANLDAIFQPFNQFSSKLKNDGVGLGLFICQYLVELMNGTLTIESQYNKGTQCCLTIPLLSQVLDEQVFDEYESIVAFQGSMKTVLIVDDIAHNLEILSDMLTPIGFNVIVANSGLACLEQLKTIEVDLVLLDLIMPGLNGIETCQGIQAIEFEHSPKIIMITANAFEEDRQQCMQAGCDDFLAKPVLFGQLFEKIGRQLGLQWILKENPKQVEHEDFSVRPLRILVADDNEINRLLMEHYLLNMNVVVKYATEGEQAFQLIQEYIFDCIILDYKMPKKTGVEIVKYFQNHETLNKQCYWILMSALLTDEIKDIATQTGFNAVLSKPIDLDNLNSFLNEAQNQAML